MNVLHVITGRGPTGPAAAAMTDVKALRAAGHTAYIASRQGSGLMLACDEESVPYVSGLKLGRGAMRLWHLPYDVRQLRGIVRNLSIDVIHVHRSDDQILASAAIGKKLSARMVRTWHRDPMTIPRPFLSRLARQSDGSVCVSRQHAEALRSVGVRQCDYIPVAVDVETFTPRNSEEPPPLIRIGHVGRWKRSRDGKDRGQRAALDVFSRLPKDANWKGLLIGRGEMAEELRREAFEIRGLSSEQVELVKFEKQAPRGFASMLASLQLGLVFTTGSDGTSRAAAELLACGVPLMVADIAGLRELAEDAASGSRHVADDPTGWAAAISKLLQDREALTRMSRAARQRAEGVHSLKARGESLAAFYRGL